jgi:8-oxo-dGTP diphosphatase
MISLRILCFLRRGDQVLLLRRRRPPHAGLWNAVGGKVKAAEDPFTACVREVVEETGFRIAGAQLRAVEVVSVRSTGALWVLFVFTADAPPGEPARTEEGDLRWVAVERIASLPVPPDLTLLVPLLWIREQVLTVRVDLDDEDASTVTHLEILGPADVARVVYAS